MPISGGKRAKGKGWIHRYPLPIVPSDQTVQVGGGGRFLSIPYYFTPASIPRIHGVLDPFTRGVWVTDPASIDICWTRGFFGKGSLSRSEPSWAERRCRELGWNAEGVKGLSSEEMTALRRTKRKMEKAKKAGLGAGEDVPDRTELVDTQSPVLPAYIDNLEHLHLTLEEAFFLQWALGCLHVTDKNGREVDSMDLWQSSLEIKADLSHGPSEKLRPDHPFLIDYFVYHHYRSLGWCARSGLKFCVDYILYKRGPVFHHAEKTQLDLVIEYQSDIIPGKEDSRLGLSIDPFIKEVYVTSHTGRPFGYSQAVYSQRDLRQAIRSVKE